LDVHRDQAAILETLAAADGDNLALLGLLLRGVGNDDAGLGLGLGGERLEQQPVVQGLEFHDVSSVLRTGAAYRKRPCWVSTRQPPLELRGSGVVERHTEARHVAIVLTAAHVSIAIEPGDGGAVAQRYGHLTGLRAAQPLLDRLQEDSDAL